MGENGSLGNWYTRLMGARRAPGVSAVFLFLAYNSAYSWSTGRPSYIHGVALVIALLGSAAQYSRGKLDMEEIERSCSKRQSPSMPELGAILIAHLVIDVGTNARWQSAPHSGLPVAYCASSKRVGQYYAMCDCVR